MGPAPDCDFNRLSGRCAGFHRAKCEVRPRSDCSELAFDQVKGLLPADGPKRSAFKDYKSGRFIVQPSRIFLSLCLYFVRPFNQAGEIARNASRADKSSALAFPNLDRAAKDCVSVVEAGV
jgi:hypothetical protein